MATITSPGYQFEKIKFTEKNVKGSLFERWFLKTLINLSYKSKYMLGEFGEKEGVPHEYLVDVVFGKVPFTHHMGLYTLVLDGQLGESRGEISFTPLIKDGKYIGGAVFSFRGIDFFLSLVSAKPPQKLGELDIKGFSRSVLESTLIYHCPKMEWSKRNVPLYKVNVSWN